MDFLAIIIILLLCVVAYALLDWCIIPFCKGFKEAYNDYNKEKED